MHYTRRSLVLAALGLAGATALAACAPPPAQTEATAAAKTGGAAPAAPKPTEAPAKPAAEAKPDAGAKPAAGAPAAPGATELVFHCRQGDLANHFVAYAKKWSEANPKTPIKMETMVATTEYWVKLAALHASKSIGDNIVDISRFFPELAYKGVYREVEPYVQSEKFDLGQYYPAAVENGRFDGKLYCLPETYQYQSMLIYYNRDMFDAAGVKYPDTMNATFDEVVEKATKLTKAADNLYGYGGANGSHHIIIRSFGGDVLDAERKKSRLNEPEAIKATEWIHDLIYKHKAAPSPEQVSGGDTNMFAGGKLAMLQSTLWTGTFLIPLVGSKFKYGAAVLPKGPTGVMGNHSQSDLVGVTANSKNPDVAWQIAKFMTAKDIGIEKVYLNAGGPGARPDVQSDPGLLEKMIGLKEFQAVLKEGRKPFLEPKPWNVRTQELNDAFGQNTDPIWLNKVPPAQGMQKVHQEAQKVLDKPRP